MSKTSLEDFNTRMDAMIRDITKFTDDYVDSLKTGKLLKIKDDMRRELTSILGELTSRDGEIKTYDDVLKELLACYRKKTKS